MSERCEPPAGMSSEKLDSLLNILYAKAVVEGREVKIGRRVGCGHR
jgi:hypothetical protein